MGEKRYIAMHHKFAIFDGEGVISGSYNWAYTGSKSDGIKIRENETYDNIMSTSNFDIVRKYQNEFDRIWKEAK